MILASQSFVLDLQRLVFVNLFHFLFFHVFSLMFSPLSIAISLMKPVSQWVMRTSSNGSDSRSGSCHSVVHIVLMDLVGGVTTTILLLLYCVYSIITARVTIRAMVTK